MWTTAPAAALMKWIWASRRDQMLTTRASSLLSPQASPSPPPGPRASLSHRCPPTPSPLSLFALVEWYANNKAYGVLEIQCEPVPQLHCPKEEHFQCNMVVVVVTILKVKLKRKHIYDSDPPEEDDP
jgi:hypothetical protein